MPHGVKLPQVEFTREKLDAGDRRFLAEEFANFPASTWMGSPHALAPLGLDQGGTVTESAALAVLEHRSARRDGATVVESQLPSDLGASAPAHTLFTVRAPDEVQATFFTKAPEDRERIKQDLLVATDEMLSRLTLTYGLDSTSDEGGIVVAKGYAALVTTDKELYRHPDESPAQVEGVIVAIGRLDGSLAAADGSRLLSEEARILANEFAAVRLEGIGMPPTRALADLDVTLAGPEVGFEP